MARYVAARTVSFGRPLSLIVKASLFTLLVLGTLALSACDESGPAREDPDAFAWRGDLAAPGVLQIRNTVGPITVEPSADSQIHVRASTRWSKGDPTRDVKFNVVSGGSIVTVCAVWGRGTCTANDYSSNTTKKRFSFGRSRSSDARVSLTVQVPAGVRVDASTVSGEVNVRASAPVRARTVDGSIKVGTSVGPVNAETVNGSVDVRMTTIGDTGAVRAVTTNGSAVAFVPDITDGRVEASTLNGRIGTDFGSLPAAEGRSNRKFEGMIGAGGRRYVVKSLNGSAWLRLINADGTVRPAERDKGSPNAR